MSGFSVSSQQFREESLPHQCCAFLSSSHDDFDVASPPSLVMVRSQDVLLAHGPWGAYFPHANSAAGDPWSHLIITLSSEPEVTVHGCT